MGRRVSPSTDGAAPLAKVRTPFLTLGRLLGAAALYVLLALVPQRPLDGALLLVRLMTAPPPVHLAMPVDGVRVRDLRDSWGNPRSGARRHEGIDIFAPRGTRVVASSEGIVWRVGTDRLGGLVVWVLGAGGRMHYYAHLDRTSGRRAGDPVGIGDTLGYVGTTGNARGGPPHLHYGVYAGADGAINPYPLLVARPPAISADAQGSDRAAPRPAPPGRS